MSEPKAEGDIEASNRENGIGEEAEKNAGAASEIVEDVGAAAPESAEKEEEKQPEAADGPAASKSTEKKTKKEKRMNPKFKDLEETGKWGEVGKTEKYVGMGILVLVIIGVVVALVVTSGDDEAPAEAGPAPTAVPSASPTLTPPATPAVKLQTIFDALEKSESVGDLANATSLPRDVTFYDGLATQDSAPAHQRAMSWLLSTEYEQFDDFEEYPIRFALASIYYQLEGEAWERATNWLSSKDICEWEGIACEVGTDELREVFLDRNNLVGTIPVEIALLRGVSKLWISHNQLSGPIPGESFGELTGLTVLYLEHNQLTGTIPASLNANGILGKK